MQSLNYLVVILTVAGVLVILGFTPLIRKLKIQFYCLQVFAAILFLYVFFGRQIIYIFPDIYGTAAKAKNAVANVPLDSLRLSRIFLLDLCPFFALIGPIFIFLRQKKVAGVLAIFGFYGAAITLFGELIFTPLKQEEIVKFLFVGLENNQVYFMMHFLSFLLSLAVFLWDDGFSLISFFYIHVFALAYLSYVALMVNIFKGQITGNTTGILAEDWLSGEYKNVAVFLKLDPKNADLIFGVSFGLSYFAIVLLTVLVNIPTFIQLTKNKQMVKLALQLKKAQASVA
ncbi:hypothetical protein F529_01515 [Mycoplasmoides pneumoniae MAC]|uniref:DUF5378 family protein n=1 Tax=Mycoplasmoides pneumoniae TaxID=2104 RepID=UPI0006A6E62A|nr:DUF5378 family protein [Mycoplasmoides pneumoniae]ALA38609.1 hypothetical protein F529_01515 [Mycoplasmoides pneumoniae MAC]